MRRLLIHDKLLAVMHAFPVPDDPPFKAIYVTTDAQRRAFAVVDAIDELQTQLGAYRAVEQLTKNDKLDREESLAPLQRSDLAMLLGVLNANLEAHCAKAREAAVIAAKGE